MGPPELCWIFCLLFAFQRLRCLENGDGNLNGNGYNLFAKKKIIFSYFQKLYHLLLIIIILTFEFYKFYRLKNYFLFTKLTLLLIYF